MHFALVFFLTIRVLTSGCVNSTPAICAMWYCSSIEHGTKKLVQLWSWVCSLGSWRGFTLIHCLFCRIFYSSRLFSKPPWLHGLHGYSSSDHIPNKYTDHINVFTITHQFQRQSSRGSENRQRYSNTYTTIVVSIKRDPRQHCERSR